MGLLTNRITNKSEKSNLIHAHAPSREPVPLKYVIGVFTHVIPNASFLHLLKVVVVFFENVKERKGGNFMNVQVHCIAFDGFIIRAQFMHR